MDEFNSRVGAQRAIVNAVNARSTTEPLFGLSRRSIDRWIRGNKLNNDDAIVQQVNLAARELFFLANHSEDQISDQYRTASEKLSDIRDDIDRMPSTD